MRNTIASVLCACLGVTGLNCGAAVDSTEPQQSDSELLMNVVSIKQPDGTRKKTIYYVTPAQRKAEADARNEALRLHKLGIEQLLAIVNGNCNTDQVTELYSQPDFAGTKCCVMGQGWDTVQNLCGFVSMGSLYSAWHDGAYGNLSSGCNAGFSAVADEPILECLSNSWIELY